MNRKNLYEAMTEIDPALIEGAAPDTRTKGKTFRLRLVAVAAAALLLTVAVMIPLGVMHRSNTPPPVEQTSDPASGAVSESPSEPVNESPESPSEEIVYDEDTFRPYSGRITFSENSKIEAVADPTKLQTSHPQSTPATPREHQEVMIIDLFKTHLEGSYQGSYKTGTGELIDFYKTKDEIYFSVSHESGRLVSYSNETSILPNLNRDLRGKALPVEEIYAEIDKLAAASVPDLSAYTLTLERDIPMEDDHGGYHGFDLVTKKYRKVIGGVETNDSIWITMTTLGEVTEFVARDIGYYDDVQFVDFEIANYDDDIREICWNYDSYFGKHRDSCTLEYTITMMNFGIYNGEYKVLCYVDFLITMGDDHSGEIIAITINPDSVVLR